MLLRAFVFFLEPSRRKETGRERPLPFGLHLAAGKAEGKAGGGEGRKGEGGRREGGAREGKGGRVFVIYN